MPPATRPIQRKDRIFAPRVEFAVRLVGHSHSQLAQHGPVFKLRVTNIKNLRSGRRLNVMQQQARQLAAP